MNLICPYIDFHWMKYKTLEFCFVTFCFAFPTMLIPPRVRNFVTRALRRAELSWRHLNKLFTTLMENHILRLMSVKKLETWINKTEMFGSCTCTESFCKKTTLGRTHARLHHVLSLFDRNRIAIGNAVQASLLQPVRICMQYRMNDNMMHWNFWKLADFS